MGNAIKIIFVVCCLCINSFSIHAKNLNKCKGIQNEEEPFLFQDKKYKLLEKYYHNCFAEIYCSDSGYCANPENKTLTTINYKTVKQSGNFHYYYKGDFKNGKFNGEGTKEFRDYWTYNGQFKNGKMDGKGTKKYKKGWIYEGSFENDKRSGIGKYYNKKLDFQYKGLFVNNELIRGKYKTPSFSYEGEFRAKKPHGFGTIKYINGDVYEGNWDLGKLSGKGKYHRLKNDHSIENKYEGMFLDGSKHGKGVLTFVNEKTIYEGTWKKNIPHGIFIISYDPKFTMYDANKNPTTDQSKAIIFGETKYEGFINSNYEKHGKGKMFLANNKIAEGKFINGRLDGLFKYTNSNGKVEFSYYANGNLDKAETNYIRGNMFKNGDQVLQDYVKALKYYKKAVHLEHKEAMLEVAKLYNEKRINVKLNELQKLANYFNDGKTDLRKRNIKAHMWANLSGNKEYRDKIKLTSDEVLEAQELAKKCLKKKYKGCDN